MYIDEIKILLKEIEKSVRGDKRWIENDDYKLKDKLEILLKDNNNLKKSQNHENVIMLGNDFHNEYKKKSNVKLSNDKSSNGNIIQLPSNLMQSIENMTKSQKMPKENMAKPQKMTNLETLSPIKSPLESLFTSPLGTTQVGSCQISMKRLDNLEEGLKNLVKLTNNTLG